MITLDGIELPDELLWEDEFSWAPAAQIITPTLTGVPFIEDSAAPGCRPMTLIHDNKAWVTRAQLRQLKNKETALGGSMVLAMHDGSTYRVCWRRDPRGIDADPIVDYADPADSDFYTITLRFTILETLQ